MFLIGLLWVRNLELHLKTAVLISCGAYNVIVEAFCIVS